MDDSSDNNSISSTESASDKRLSQAWGDDGDEEQEPPRQRRRLNEAPSAVSRPLGFTKPSSLSSSSVFTKEQNLEAARRAMALPSATPISSSIRPPPPSKPAPIPGGMSSVAARYLAKHGFTGRLGAQNQGIEAPIQVMVRPEGVGLGLVEEASSLPDNRANTLHLERIRLEAEAREQRERERLREAAEIDDLWRMLGSGADVAPWRGNEDQGPGADFAARLAALQGAAAAREHRALAQAEAVRAAWSMNQAEKARLEGELARLDSRLGELRACVASTVRPLMDCAPAQVEHLMRQLQDRFSGLMFDYGLDRLGPALVARAVGRHGADDDCLDLVAALQRAGLPVEQAVVKLVPPRLDWKDPQLHLLVLPWLEFAPNSLEAFLGPVRAELELRLETCTACAQAAALLGPWRELIDEAQIGRMLARRVGPKLDSAANASEWFDAKLLPRLEACCVAEVELGTRVRPRVHEALAAQDWPAAARVYRDWKRVLPRALLLDAPSLVGGNRLRLRCDAVLDEMEAALEGRRPVQSDGWPRSFGEALLAHRGGGTERASTLVPPKVLMRDQIQRFAEQHEVVFVPAPDGQVMDGKKVYFFGRIPVVMDDGVVFALLGEEGWAPVSLEKLLQVAA